MLAVRKDLGLVRQVRATTVHEVDARQTVFAGNFLGTQMLLHRHRVIGAALNRRIIADDHDFPARDPAHAGDHASAVNLVIAIHATCRQSTDLQEGRTGVEQSFDTITGQQLAAADMFLACALRAPDRGLGGAFAQFSNQRLHHLAIGLEAIGIYIERAGQLGHEIRVVLLQWLKDAN